ncbi:hypothetical protein HNY73_001911 [Argiope bruennichi]|uniref:Uncharacterized protein n=1 Tax=Argiope bruennichi TaxID=94029 RepID=A0A8T0FW55_ARGBR|nr:hypothetical protein HNY73_001911 [Argiope bruennichi]
MDDEQRIKNATKQKRYYEKKRNDPDFKEKEKLRQKKIRDLKAATMTKKEKKKQKQAARERQRKCRAAKKISNSTKISSLNSSIATTPECSPYTVPQTLGKAVKKTLKALPTSPRKRMAVVSNLVEKVGLKLQKERESNISDNNQNKELVADFLCRADIVYTAPGMHDEMIIWENGIKKRVRKHFLTMYMKEAHALFKEENPSINIGYSKFCSLRPKNVLLLKDTPSDQCKCKSHENFILLLKGLNIDYNNDFWKEVLCNSDLESKCWETKCDKCNAGKLLLDFIGKKGLNNASNVQWHQWVKSENKRFYKETNEGCIAELTDNVLENFQSFKQHVKIKRIQAAAFQSDIKQSNTVVLQVDFAMSYSCEWQSEIQSALWSRENVTLFTAALFEKNHKTQSYLIVSDTKDKSKLSVSAFILKLLEIIKFQANKPKLIIWSDGPSSEFKNKFICYFLFILFKTQKHFSSFEWKYSATSHGKGVVDGIGGTAKSRVYAEVKARRAIVQNAVDFATVAAKVVQNITVIPMLQKDIDKTQIDWNLAKDVPGIKKAHIIKCLDEHICLFTSQQNLDTTVQELCFCKNTEQCLKRTPLLAQNHTSAYISLGKFLLVKVFGKKSWKPYVAQVSALDNTEINVIFLKQVSVCNFIYQENDIGVIQRDDIIRVLPTPIINGRNTVIFQNAVM